MTNIESTIAILRQFNKWRRGADMPQPNPKKIGLAIDAAIAELEKTNKGVSKCRKRKLNP